MPGKILGIDISEHNISAVQVISGLKGYQMVACFSTPVKDHNLEKALEELAGRFDLKSDKSLLTIPASNISFRNINTPFKDSKKIRQTLPFEIETLVPFSVNERIIDYIHTDADNPASILAAAINKDYIGDYIERLKDAGVEPDIIDIRPVPAVTWLLGQEKTPASGIYLDLEPEHPCVVIFQNRKIVVIRELPCSFSENPADGDPEENAHSPSEPIENIINTICREADRTVFSFNSKTKNSFTLERVFFGGRLSGYNNTSGILNNFFEAPAERIQISKDSRLKMEPGIPSIYESVLMDHALAAALREDKKSIGLNFRRDEFAVKRRLLGPGKDIRRVALLICVFLVLMFVNTGVDYYYINKTHATAEEIFNKEFEKKFPEQKGIKETKTRLLFVQQKLKELDKPSTQVSDGVRSDQKVLDVLKDISERVDEKYDFDVDNLTIRNNEVTISATTDNYATVDIIANALKKSPLFKKVEIINPGQAKDRIKFDLKLIRTE
jgi:general secretion pathway protein L